MSESLYALVPLPAGQQLSVMQFERGDLPYFNRISAQTVEKYFYETYLKPYLDPAMLTTIDSKQTSMMDVLNRPMDTSPYTDKDTFGTVLSTVSIPRINFDGVMRCITFRAGLLVFTNGMILNQFIDKIFAKAALNRDTIPTVLIEVSGAIQQAYLDEMRKISSKIANSTVTEQKQFEDTASMLEGIAGVITSTVEKTGRIHIYPYIIGKKQSETNNVSMVIYAISKELNPKMNRNWKITVVPTTTQSVMAMGDCQYLFIEYDKHYDLSKSAESLKARFVIEKNFRDSVGADVTDLLAAISSHANENPTSYVYLHKLPEIGMVEPVDTPKSDAKSDAKSDNKTPGTAKPDDKQQSTPSK